MQPKINYYNDVIFEWIPYNQFDNIIKEISKDGFATAIWKDGPLYYCLHKKGYERKLGKKLVALKYLHSNSQNITNEFYDKVIKCLYLIQILYCIYCIPLFNNFCFYVNRLNHI